MAKEITLKIGPAELSDILYDWTGERPTKNEAEKILMAIRQQAQERLEKEAFSIVTELTDRL